MSVERSQASFEGVIVTKPWGYEYLVYQNGTVGVWYLSIRAGARTSLHCHPKKKTGLIVLDGDVDVSFLNDSLSLGPLGKLMIRPGLFHSTMARSPDGVAVMEIETPCDKTNLVRLEDEYDRAQKPYEGTDAMVPMSGPCLRFADPERGRPRTHVHGGCEFTLEAVDDVATLRERDPGEVIVVLDGGLQSPTGDPVLGAGDVVSVATLDRLARAFPSPAGMSLVTIRRAKAA